MKFKIRQRYDDGKWQRITRRNYRVVCCDCGLSHRYNFRVRKGRLENQVFLDKPLTRAARRQSRKRD